MKGKVQCTCGWSWNKSDSSKKDMYICHECGRDNSNNISKAQDGLQTISSREKRGLDLLIKDTENAKKDQEELFSTGQIKNPRSIKNKKDKKELDKKKTYLKQENRSEAVKNYDESKGKFKEFKKNVIAPLDVATDLMQLGNFVPNPYAQIVGEIGNIAGAAIDTYEAADDVSEGEYGSAVINAGSAILPMFIEGSGYTRDMYNTNPGSFADKIASLGNRSGNYIPLTTLPNAVAPSTIKGVNFNRALLGTLGAETLYDIPKQKNGGWLDNYGIKENANEGHSSAPDNWRGEGYSNVGRNYSPAWGGQFQMGGSVYPVNYVSQAQGGMSMPGAVGFSYARTQGAAPSNGPYAKKTKASAQTGVRLDMYGAPITAIEVNDPSADRTSYDPRTNRMILGSDINDDNRAEVIAHENRHAWQFDNDRTNFNIAHHPEYAFQDRLKKKPVGPVTDEVFEDYHDRKRKEIDVDVKNFISENRNLSFMPDDLIYKKFIDSDQYSNPNSVEGEAQYYQETGKQFKEGGIIKDDRGQWDYPGEVTEISGNTMATHGYGDIPLYVVPDKGDPRMVYPNTGTHTFPGASKFTEYPVAANGMETTTDETTIPIDRSFLDKLKNDTEARKKKVNIRETPNTIANDVIPNASKMATKGDKAIVKDVKYSNKIAQAKAQAQAEAQKKFNALPKAEQERILYDQYNQVNGAISDYHPDSTLSKLGQSVLAPFTALTDLYQKGEVRDNLLQSVINNPKSANPYDAAYLGTLAYAAAPFVASGASAVGAAAAPYATMIGNSLAADAVIGGNTIAGLNLGNAINAGFATHGAMNIIPDATKWLDRPSWENVESVGMDALELLPAVGPVSKTIGEGLNASGKFVGKGFDYAANKGSQALNKVGEFAAPRIEKTKTLLNDMGAVISGEAKTIGPKINALNTAEDALYRGPEYAQHSDEVAKLRNKKWNLEGKYNKLKSYSSFSETNELTDRINKLQKRIDVAEQFKLNNEGLVQSGKNTSLGLKTGSTDIMDLSTGEKFPISTSVPSENIIHTLEGDKVVKTIDSTNLPQASPEYNTTVKKNIDFIENQIPGAKVFGSAKNVAEAEVPHIIGDYDVIMSQTEYDKFAKANPSVGNNGFAELHNIPGAAEGVEPIDINIIQEKGGKAVGQRAEELFKQFAPDEYYKAVKQSIKNKSEIKIPYSSQELVDMTNPTTKSVVDAYESTKDKHLNKIDALINYGKPSVVAEGQQQFVKSLVGSKGSIGHQFPLEQLSNVETNKEMLDKINFIGNKALVAADPERMQIAINDYYMNNSILSRQVDKGKIDKIEAAIKQYNPDAGGGAVNGIGQNHVMLGHPFHGDGNITSFKQLGMDLDTSDPVAYINSIEHQTSGEKLFTEEERTILSDIIKDIKMDDYRKDLISQGTENTSQLIENLPYSEEGKKALYEFGKKTGRTIVKKSSQYGNSTYASTLRDFDDAIDAMQYQVTNSKNVIKSFKQRSDAAEYALNNSRTINSNLELLPKQFKAIKGYVEGGIERANERLVELKKQRQNIYDDINDLSEKVYNRKYKDEIERLNQFKEKLNKEVADISQMRRDLYDRKVHLNKLGDNMKTVTILGGGGATLIGVGTYGYKKEMESRKEFNERLKKMTKEEREQFDKDLNERIRKKDSLERTDKPYTAKAMDWFMGRNQNGGNITKAKNGNELVKLNQLTNFTNYNTKQPGGWLDQY